MSRNDSEWATSGSGFGSGDKTSGYTSGYVDETSDYQINPYWFGEEEEEDEEDEEEPDDYATILAPKWQVAMKTWGKVWPFHIYLIGAFYLLLLSQVMNYDMM